MLVPDDTPDTTDNTEVPAGWRTLEEFQKQWKHDSPPGPTYRQLKQATLSVGYTGRRFEDGRCLFYSPDELQRIRTLVGRIKAVSHSSAEKGAGIESMKRVMMQGLDGELAWYVPEGRVLKKLGVNYPTVSEACLAYWTRVQIEREDAKKMGTSISYTALPHELVCILFGSGKRRNIWVREDGVPAYIAHRKSSYAGGRPAGSRNKEPRAKTDKLDERD